MIPRNGDIVSILKRCLKPFLLVALCTTLGLRVYLKYRGRHGAHSRLLGGRHLAVLAVFGQIFTETGWDAVC